MALQADRHARTLEKLLAHHAKRQYIDVPQSKNCTVRAKVAALVTKGRECWQSFHLYPVEHWEDWDASAASKWFAKWETTIPRYGCGCRRKWKDLKKTIKPDFSSAAAFFEYTIAAHNAVNHDLGKPQFASETAIEWYRSTTWRKSGNS